MRCRPCERIITVEKNLLELRLEDDPRHPDAPALFTRHANSEGEGEITTRQLVELTRRLNPDRVVVGELVEDEALDMLDVASMCKRGSLATIHAHTADIVLQRLAYYVSKSNTSLPEFAVWSLIAQTVDFVIHIDLVRNAVEEQAPVRRVTSIIEVGGLGEAGGVASTEVWTIDDTDELVAGRTTVATSSAIACASPDIDPICSPREAPVSLESVILVISTMAGIAAVVVVFGPDRPPRARRPFDARPRSPKPCGRGCRRVGADVLGMAGARRWSWPSGVGSPWDVGNVVTDGRSATWNAPMPWRRGSRTSVTCWWRAISRSERSTRRWRRVRRRSGRRSVDSPPAWVARIPTSSSADSPTISTIRSATSSPPAC